MAKFNYPEDFEGTFWTVVDGDYYVSTVGNDLSGDGSPQNPFLSVHRAFELAETYEKIVIGPDEYLTIDGTMGLGINASATDIADRDAQAGALQNLQDIYVTDASADPTVNSGWAVYKYLQGSGAFIKIAEQESIELQDTGGLLVNLEDNGPNVQNASSGTGNFQWGNVQIDGDAINAPGDITANDFIATSDIRLKTDVAPILNHKDIYHLNTYRHGWEHKNDMTFGLMAQEVERYFPELVKTDANGYKAMSYVKLIPLMLEAIKDLKQQLDTLRS